MASLGDLVRAWHLGAQAVERGDWAGALRLFSGVPAPPARLCFNAGCVHLLAGDAEAALRVSRAREAGARDASASSPWGVLPRPRRSRGRPAAPDPANAPRRWEPSSLGRTGTERGRAEGRGGHQERPGQRVTHTGKREAVGLGEAWGAACPKGKALRPWSRPGGRVRLLKRALSCPPPPAYSRGVLQAKQPGAQGAAAKALQGAHCPSTRSRSGAACSCASQTPALPPAPQSRTPLKQAGAHAVEGSVTAAMKRRGNCALGRVSTSLTRAGQGAEPVAGTAALGRSLV
ncbi:hypothetical protein P7K49_002223 [Saguinus oedipus]|uniref:Uncharacterized protein n=1 Tax=Saguinus oedipus TaxID=9490 RepID=A0ABQ9WGR3_SAGOE|nr:hypothetical protein P7K49_002223 [Saguinus oedipus]